MMNRESSRRGKRSRAAMSGLLAASVVAGTIAGSARPAHAIEPATVTAVLASIKFSYDAYKVLQGLLNPATPGPTLQQISERLMMTQEAIILEMRTQRNSMLSAGARTALNLFNDLANNLASDPVNTSLWTSTRTQSQTVADQMFDIIVNIQDGNSAYELGPVYNTLLVTGTGVLRIKGQIWPGFPSSWNDHQAWLRAGMAGNYKMIASQRHQCSTGSNPGYLPPPNSATVVGKYNESLLWKKLITNRWMTVRQFPCGSTQCNTWTFQCVSQVTTACNPSGGFNWSACGNLSISDRDCIVMLTKPTFDADGAVKIIREGMIGIQKLSGGNDFQFNDGLMSQGKFVDPWVTETSCTPLLNPTFNRRAYAQQP